MARLVLHIGPHKTGTTYIQNLFHKNRDALEKAGILYPDFSPDTAHHVLASPWLTRNVAPAYPLDPRGPEGPWDDFIAKYAQAEGTVFLSSENFSRCHPEAVDMKELAQRLSDFEDVRIISMMRAQTQMVQSIWLQISKMGRPRAIYSFMHTVLEERRASGIWIDYNSAYESMLSGFDPKQIYFFDYGESCNLEGGLAQPILDFLDADIRAQDLVPLEPSAANISPDPLGFWIACEITSPDLPSAALVAAVTQPLKDTGRPNTLLARHEYVKMATRYAAANAKLVERLQTTQPGFIFQEVVPPEDMIYREEIPNATWLQIAKAAAAVPDKMQRPDTATGAGTRNRLERLARRLTGQ